MAAGRDPVASDPPLPSVLGVFGEVGGPDPRTPTDGLLGGLRTGPSGLSHREAQRRLVRYGPNELVPFPLVVWAVDDCHRRLVRARREDLVVIAEPVP